MDGSHPTAPGRHRDLKTTSLSTTISQCRAAAIGLIPTTSVLTSDWNMIVSDQNFANFKGTLSRIGAWQAAGQDAHSVAKAVEFVAPRICFSPDPRSAIPTWPGRRVRGRG
jgi:hypothetical protein